MNLCRQARHHSTLSARYLRVQGTVHALRTIAASEGASGLMRGFWPTVLSNAPFSAIYYMLYTDLRQRFHKVPFTYAAEHVHLLPTRQLRPLSTCVAGAHYTLRLASPVNLM